MGGVPWGGSEGGDGRVRLGKGRGQRGERKEEEAKEKAGKDDKPTGADLPPTRTFVPPTVPREALVRQLEEEEVRAAAMREEGAPEQQIQKIEKKRKKVEEQLKSAGGRTAQSLGLQIKKEEDYKRKALAGMERCSGQVKELEDQVKELQKQITEELEKKERHRERGEAAEARLAWLAMQKAKESLPVPFLAKVRAAASAVASMECKESGPLRELLSILVAALEAVDIAGSDTSENTEGTEEVMGRSNWEAESGLETFEEEAMGGNTTCEGQFQSHA